MPERVRLSELSAMSPAEFRAQVEQLVRAQQRIKESGSPALNARIRAFERRYEMSSESLLGRLRAGELRETAEICEWLLLLAARDPKPLAHR